MHKYRVAMLDKPTLGLVEGVGGASGSQSALHMHVLVCICSNVRQFSMTTGMIHVCYHTICLHVMAFIFVNTSVFLCYKTRKGALLLPSCFPRFPVTLLVQALLGQAPWIGTSPQGKSKGYWIVSGGVKSLSHSLTLACGSLRKGQMWTCQTIP